MEKVLSGDALPLVQAPCLPSFRQLRARCKKNLFLSLLDLDCRQLEIIHLPKWHISGPRVLLPLNTGSCHQRKAGFLGGCSCDSDCGRDGVWGTPPSPGYDLETAGLKTQLRFLSKFRRGRRVEPCLSSQEAGWRNLVRLWKMSFLGPRGPCHTLMSVFFPFGGGETEVEPPADSMHSCAHPLGSGPKHSSGIWEPFCCVFHRALCRSGTSTWGRTEAERPPR